MERERGGKRREGEERNRRRSLLCLHLGPRFLPLSLLPAFLVSIFPFFLFLFCLFEESVFFYSFYLFCILLLSSFFFRVKRNAIHFCWHGSHPFSHLALLQPLPGRCCRSRTVPPAACPAFSHAPRDQSHPPNRLRWEVKRWGPPNEKHSGKIQQLYKNKQNQNKSSTRSRRSNWIVTFAVLGSLFLACIYFYF